MTDQEKHLRNRNEDSEPKIKIKRKRERDMRNKNQLINKRGASDYGDNMRKVKDRKRYINLPFVSLSIFIIFFISIEWTHTIPLKYEVFCPL